VLLPCYFRVIFVLFTVLVTVVSTVLFKWSRYIYNEIVYIQA